jgi:hypothetical protein
VRLSIQSRDRLGCAALAFYLAFAILLFGRTRAVYSSTSQLGLTGDPSFLMWALTWWPYAIRHRLNPFICRLVWAPDGFNLAWSGGMPLAALVAAPLTSVAGPVATYNVMAIAAPALAAWCAFLMCRGICGSYWASMVGGYVFGFSPYVLGQLAGGHLNLLWVFPAPLIALLMWRALEGSIAPARFAALLSASFVVEFLCSIELAATTAIFGACALIAGWLMTDATGRDALKRLARPLAYAGAGSILVLSPYIYYLVQPGAPRGAINSPGAYSADLLNLIIPTRTVELGLLPAFQRLASWFPGNLGERDAYLGLPLLFVIVHHGWMRWREPATRVLIGSIAIVVVCALGPRIRVDGWTGFPMPWKLAMHIPMFKSALPSRFMNYGFLAASLIVARRLADEHRRKIWRVTAAAILMLSALPNLDAVAWFSPTNVPAFFAEGGERQAIRDETIIAIPYGIRGNTMLWQATAGMSFRMAGGYTGRTPREFERWPIVNALMTATLIPDASAQLAALMAAHDATVVVVDEAHREMWARMLEAIDPKPQHTGGIWLYRADPARLRAYHDASPLVMEERNAEARFAALLAAARDYLAAGNDPAALTPARAQALHLLPANWVTDRDVRTNNGLYLGRWTGGQIAIGIVGSYDALRPLIAKYRTHAAKIFFPFPKELEGEPTGDTFMRLLVMVFDRRAIAAMPAMESAEPIGIK